MGSLWLLACLVVVARSASPYDYLSYDEIVSRLSAYSTLDDVRVYSAQREFALPSPGRCGKADCETWVIEIGPSGAEIPEVFVSGEIHGDERIGPVSVMAAIELMLSDTPDAWISRLRATRRVVFVPTTNALGFYFNTRTENGIDTNRDYPIDRTDDKCMTTVTSRIVNELFRRHLFRIALTFHGGMRAIAYEWGTIAHGNDASPDDAIQAAMGSALSVYAGGHEFYPHGSMNSIVYPVHGGLEDWAYGASWDSREQRPCVPSTFGGYPREKTTYDDSALRCITMLVETSTKKNPPKQTLGSRDEVLTVQVERPGRDGYGHVPRNVRVILAAIDYVEPYVFVVSADRVANGAVELRVVVGGCFEASSTLLKLYDVNEELLSVSEFFSQDVCRWRASKAAAEEPANLTFDVVDGAVFVKVEVLNVDAKLIGKSPQSHLARARADDAYRATAMESGNAVVGAKSYVSEMYVLEDLPSARTDAEYEHEHSQGRPEAAPPSRLVWVLCVGALVCAYYVYTRRRRTSRKSASVEAEPLEEEELIP